MELFSMTQFKKYCDKHAGATFTYDSRNDVSRIGTNFHYAADSYKVSHIGYYDNVIIMLNPNRVCFKNKYAAVIFDCVEKILLESGAFDTIHIICKNDTAKHIILANKEQAHDNKEH